MVSFTLDVVKFLLIYRHLQNTYWFKTWKLYARFANVVRFMNRISNILSFMARNLFSIVIMSPYMAWWCIGK